jgi:hypothetical protein
VSGEWTTIDKSGWGPGPWQDEPDKIHWIDPNTDLDCLMVRNPNSGNWCGYVAVTEGHPFYGKDYNEVYRLRGDDYLDVHGGLTYSDFCMQTDDESRFVCHVPHPGRPEKVWWLGFDCAHAWDVSPGYMARHPDWPVGADAVYRDRPYVEAEVRSLAAQLKAVRA